MLQIENGNDILPIFSWSSQRVEQIENENEIIVMCFRRRFRIKQSVVHDNFIFVKFSCVCSSLDYVQLNMMMILRINSSKKPFVIHKCSYFEILVAFIMHC